MPGPLIAIVGSVHQSREKEFADRAIPLFHFIQDTHSEWEIFFYRSLRNADGVILLGGGTSTLIAGLVAMGFGKSIVACETFGGYASKIWGIASRISQPAILTRGRSHGGGKLDTRIG